MTNLFVSINWQFWSSFIFSVIRVSTPIIFAALGALIAQQAGIANLATEGIMLVSALFGVLGSYFFSNIWLGVFIGVISGVVMSIILGYTVIYLESNLILTCVALNMMASGGTIFIMYLVAGNKGTTSSLSSGRVPAINIPVIKNIPILGEIISGHSILTYVAIASVLIISYVLWKTPFGLKIRAVGENPDAATSVGINAKATKLIALAVSGVFAGLGGVFMSMSYLTWFAKEMVSGRGFIGLSAMNLGNVTPGGSFFASIVFGLFDVLSNLMQNFKIPVEFVQMLPYIATIIGLVLYSRRTTSKQGDDD